MTTSESGPEPYRVMYSDQARQRLRFLATAARERGDSESFVTALKEFHHRLCIYPQFGEQLTELKEEVGQVWIGIVRPRSMRYAVFDELRTVMVAPTPVLLKKSDSTESD